MQEVCKFVYIEMSYTETSSTKSKNTNVSLEERYTTNDMALLKKSIAELTKKQDYKTLNKLFRRNPNTSKFDTRTLNEYVPQDNKRFTKRNCKLCNVSRAVPRKQEAPQNEEQSEYTYKARIYDPNAKSFFYINKFHQPYASRIRARYF